MSVPPEVLVFDPETSRGRSKISPDETRRVVASIPEVYRLRAQGTTREEFQRMARSPRSPQERLIGATHERLFDPSLAPLRADINPAGRLEAVAGQHRLREAQRQDLAYVPVQVSVRSRDELERLRAESEKEVRLRTPEIADSINRLDREQDDALTRARRDREGPDRDSQDGFRFGRSSDHAPRPR